jgi:thermitase
LDTGIDISHEDLKDALWVNPKESNGKKGFDDDGNGYIDDINGFNVFGNSSNLNDELGHGTQVSGLIAANHENGLGISGVASSHVKIMTVKTIGAGGVFHLESAVKGIHYAVDQGAKIINASWNLPSDLPGLKEAIEYAHQKGVLFVNSAGNEGLDIEIETCYPSLYNLPNMITVASLRQGNLLEYTSNYHADYVHIGAPGTEMLTTDKNNSYKSVSGTSFAAPLVSAAAAMALAQNPLASMIEIKELVLRSARPELQLNGKVAHGILHIPHVLLEIDSSSDDENPLNWNQLPQRIETNHPYKREQIQQWQIAPDGARDIVLHFDRFHLTFGDSLEVWSRDGVLLQTFKGRVEGKFESSRLPGNILLKFISDNDNFQAWGFSIKRILWRK